MAACRSAIRTEMKAGDVPLVAEGMTVRYLFVAKGALTVWPIYLNFQLLPMSAGRGIGARP
jgi:hypothetical protein